MIIDNGGASGTNTPLSLSTGFDLTIGTGAVVESTPSTLNVRSLLIRSNGWLTSVQGQSQSPVTLTIVCSNAVIMEGGGINGDGKGFAGGSGTGAGHSISLPAGVSGGGGAYGGYGGPSSLGAAGGAYYGSLQQPFDFGSGGGAGAGSAPYSLGGSGGGAIRLTVTGTLTLNGRITANGGNGFGQGSGGGSGGSVWLTLGSFSGAGLVAANGGPGEPPFGGGGGGGRIAIYYSGPNAFSGILSTHGGTGGNNGSAGTIYSQATNAKSVQLTIDNNGLSATNTIFALGNGYLGGDLIVSGSAAATPSSSSLTIGALFVKSNSWLIFSNASHTLSTMMVTSNATIEAGGGIMLDGKGYPASQGPGTGAPRTGSGAGHGGYGGNSVLNSGGGNSYGSFSTPTESGSGGSYSNTPSLAGAGGGSIHLTVIGTLALDGAITANGTVALGQGNGGGSGGAIWLNVGKLMGAGSISANGGAGNLPIGGGGGGGRISIYYTSNLFTGTISARGGPGANYGGAGTVYSRNNNAASAQLIVDNGGSRGTNTPANTSPQNLGFANLTVSGGATVFSTFLSGLTTLQIASNSMVIYSNRSSVTVSSNVIIQTGGAFLLDGMGYSSGFGPGAGHSLFTPTNGYTSSGAGYGGFGGNAASAAAVSQTSAILMTLRGVRASCRLRALCALAGRGPRHSRSP